MNQSRRTFLTSSAILLAAAPLAACGTIMYPERKGQKSGKIDPTVAVLNGIGLLLFLVPGVIAFAVDFSNGTIYLPGTQRRSETTDGIREVAYRGNLTKARLDEVWQNEYGHSAPFELEDLERRELADLRHMATALAAYSDLTVQAG